MTQWQTFLLVLIYAILTLLVVVKMIRQYMNTVYYQLGLTGRIVDSYTITAAFEYISFYSKVLLQLFPENTNLSNANITVQISRRNKMNMKDILVAKSKKILKFRRHKIFRCAKYIL